MTHWLIGTLTNVMAQINSQISQSKLPQQIHSWCQVWGVTSHFSKTLNTIQLSHTNTSIYAVTWRADSGKWPAKQLILKGRKKKKKEVIRLHFYSFRSLKQPSNWAEWSTKGGVQGRQPRLSWGYTGLQPHLSDDFWQIWEWLLKMLWSWPSTLLVSEVITL